MIVKEEKYLKFGCRIPANYVKHDYIVMMTSSMKSQGDLENYQMLTQEQTFDIMGDDTICHNLVSPSMYVCVGLCVFHDYCPKKFDYEIPVPEKQYFAD